jgi:hypothetical protein
VAEPKTKAKSTQPNSTQELPRTGRCLAYGCSGCQELTELPGRIAGYIYCACGHTKLIHEKQEPKT